jgi:NTP pyrophosphatase (non-canonical NTP hydrolase)
MSYFKKLIKQEIRESLIQLPFQDDPTVWTEELADNIVSKFEGQYVPFITEVEEFNTVMGKDWQNRSTPTIDKKDAEFVINFIQEELDELREAVEQENIQEILDAILDITYVGLGNGALVFGLKDKIWEAYQEVQASNLSKICTTLEEAEETVKVRSKQQGEPCHYEEVGSNYVVYRTSDKKVMKSINYFRPDLSKFFNV